MSDTPEALEAYRLLAHKALNLFSDKENALVDLLTDLMHWSTVNGGFDTFERALETAREHFQEEA